MIDPILITGCARSGTSMTAGIFHLCGAWGGEMSGPNKYNKKGMFENAKIRSVVKLYLNIQNYDPKGQFPLPEIKKLRPLPNWKNRVEGIISEQGCQENQQWLYKGAKMCLIWPIWYLAFPNAKWIIVRREDKDIINSCLLTGFMNKYNSKKGWRSWIEHHKECFRQMHETGMSIKEIWPSKFVKGDYSEIKEAIEWTGLEFNETLARDFISPDLFKHSEEE